jgi:hypothetical protein
MQAFSFAGQETFQNNKYLYPYQGEQNQELLTQALDRQKRTSRCGRQWQGLDQDFYAPVKLALLHKDLLSSQACWVAGIARTLCQLGGKKHQKYVKSMSR